MPLQANDLRLRSSSDQIITGIDYRRLEALCAISGLGDGDSESTEEAHKDFMSSYQKIFLRPKQAVPRIPLLPSRKPAAATARRREGDSSASWDTRQSQGRGRLARDHLIAQTLKALRKLPTHRSAVDQQVICRTLSANPTVSALLPPQELQQVSSIAMLEFWERQQTISGSRGLHLILRGSARLSLPGTSRTAAIGVGSCFGLLEEQEADEAGEAPPCAVTQDTCDILRIPRGAYARLKQEIEAQNSAHREFIIQSCPLYQHWPKLSIKKLSDHIQMRQLPANYVVVREGEVCPFVVYIQTGECNILRDLGRLRKKTPGKKGSKVQYVQVGKLGPGQSFGETSLLLDKPSPCTVVTATEVKAGVILASDLKGLDLVIRSLIEQTEEPSYGTLSQEQMNKMFVAQEKQREWRHIKKTVLRDALLFNGIVEGCGKWKQISARRQEDARRLPRASTL